VETPVKPGRTPRDMALSLVVLLVPVVLLVVAYRYVQGGDRPVVVDPAPAIAQAQARGVPVTAPIGLGEGWLSTAATYRDESGGGTLRIGYVTPDGGGVQLIQSTMPADALLARELGREARSTGTVPVEGQPWQRYAVRAGETALIRTDNTRTLIVIGHASDEELTTLAGSVA